MCLLIFGAGALGSFDAVKLPACGHELTVVACGRRAEQLRAEGLVVQAYRQSCLRARVHVIESLEPDAFDDQVLVLVRNDQVASVLPSLAANKATPRLACALSS